VIDAFLKDCTYKVRAVVRSPDSEGGRALVAKGAEVVKADFLDVDSLKQAFQVMSYHSSDMVSIG
jgi:uncharacterized protein YbjT (DUF2867 family)